jgi:hypothetical protein
MRLSPPTMDQLQRPCSTPPWRRAGPRNSRVCCGQGTGMSMSKERERNPGDSDQGSGGKARLSPYIA